MPRDIVSDLEAHGAKITETEDLYSMMKDADVIYMTRIQKERFSDEDEYAKLLALTSYMLTISVMSRPI